MPYTGGYRGASRNGSLKSQSVGQWKAKPKAPRTMAGTDKQLVRRAAKQAAMALALAKAQRKETEVKYTTGNFVDSSLASATVLAVNNISQGVTKTNRIGERVKVTRIIGKLKYVINYQSLNNATFRTVIVQDKQQLNSGAAPAVLDIFETQSTTGYFDDAQMDRFKVLYENVTTLNQLSETTDTCSDVINFDIKLPAGITTEFFGAGANDIVKNGIYVCTFGDTNTIANPDTGLVGGAAAAFVTWRTYFEDL